jgi:hypothetical protein
MSEQRITGFRQDSEHQWIAELECGHAQHVRHDPPWQVYPWIQFDEGRSAHIGTTLYCRRCAREYPSDS